MDTVFKSLYFREPVLHYVCPPICENIFSSSGGPVIVLNAQDHLGPITGLIMGGVGDFHIRWNPYPGAVCYTVYMLSGEPATYVVVAECIPDPDFDVDGLPDGTILVVTAITPEGETPFSDPIEVVKVPAQCPHFDPPLPDDINAGIGDDVSITFVVNEGIGFGEVNYLWLKDSVSFLDTTHTTKGVLPLENVQVSDSGEYVLHLSNNNPDCDVFSAPVTLTVADCSETLAGMHWTSTPDDACGSMSLTTYGSPPPDQAGLFSLSFSPACTYSHNVVLEGKFCNNTEDDTNWSVVAQVTGMTGVVDLWTVFSLLAYVDGGFVDQSNWVLQPAINDNLSILLLGISPGPHTIQIVLQGQIASSTGFNISGSLNATSV